MPGLKPATLLAIMLCTLASLAQGQQKATVKCINAKTVPLFDSNEEKTITGWVTCGTEVNVIGLLPNGEFYLVDAATTSGRTMRGNISKVWLTTTFVSSATAPTSTPLGAHASEKVPLPPVIVSTYSVSYPVTSSVMRARGVKTVRRTIHLHEEETKLTMDTEWLEGKSNHTSQSINYGEVNLVRIVSSRSKTEHTVDIEMVEGVPMFVPVRTDEDANELAEYVARKSPLRLELIGDAWRVRKPFRCPEVAQIGCADFKELLEHDDADIVDAFYSDGQTSPHYACFSDSSRRFFIVHYNLPGEFYKGGFFFQNIFIEGQSNTTNLVGITWTSDDYGQLLAPSTSNRGGKQSAGYIAQSELSYQNRFTNRNGTETQYSLSIRWSTGRFLESFSGKDEKGKLWNGEEAGMCVKLN